MSGFDYKLIFIMISICLLAANAESAGILSIGPTKIPFYTGNTSVTPFMVYWGTSAGPAGDLETPERIEMLKRIGCFADCDYQSWALAEKEPGKWDFSMYEKNADMLHKAGLKYIFFAWVHFPPKWFLETQDFVPYQCAEHEEKLMELSPWAPKVWDIYRRFYAAQHAAMGDKIDWIRIATPSDYGEIGYPAAMTSWLVPQKHAHLGYWCGGSYAKADFRSEMKRKFRNLKSLNARWGTSFKAWNDVTYPKLANEKGEWIQPELSKAIDRRYRLDFVDWYYGVWLRFVPKLAGVIREFYPEKPLIVSVGYASEMVMVGNDYSAVPKMAKSNCIAMQTPGNVPYYALKRVSTACHTYDCPYYTEPPGDVQPNEEVARVFNDISNGVQIYFEYPQNLDRARPQLRMYKDHMTGAKPIVDVALFNASIEHHISGGINPFPMNTYALGDTGRDRFDYDVVDELLVRDNALKNYRVLVYVQGNVTEEYSLKKIADWVRNGGTLVTCELGNVETVEGDKSIWKSLVPAKLPDIDEVYANGRFDWSGVTNLCTRKVGRGLVIQVPVKPDQKELLADITEHASYHLSDFGKGFKNAPLIDAAADGIIATLLPDRILYFNGTDKEILKIVILRPEDWANRKKPERMEYEIKLAPHSIEAILLK